MAEHFDAISTGLRSEAKLLLGCARTKIDAENAGIIIALLKENIDWSYLLHLASHHKLLPLLYQSLEAVAPTSIPETARAQLKEQIQAGIQGNLFLTKELLHLLDLFNKHSILVIPYKGPVLAVTVYRDLLLRPCNDLDILVHEHDILQAMDLLVSCGYEIIRPPSVSQTEKGLHPLQVNRLVEKSPWAYQLVLWHPEREVIVELHWRITPKYIFPDNPEQLWTDLKPVSLSGVTVFSFAPENLLWFLCVHGTKHQWARLGWLCDIAELIREYPQLNWDHVLTQANQLGIERRLYLGLHLANSMLNVTLPQPIETKIHTTPHVVGLAQQVIESMFDGSEQTTRFPYLNRFGFQLRAMDRIADRGRYLLRFINGIEIALKAEQTFAKQI